MDAFFPSWVILPECATNEFKDLLQTYSQSTHFWVGWWTPGEPGEQHSNLFRTIQNTNGCHEIQMDRVFCHITLKERGIAGNDVRWPRVKMLLHSLSPEDRLEASQFWQGFQQCLEKLEIGVRMVELPAIADDSAAETPAAADEQAELQADSGAAAEQPTLAEDEDSSLIKILFLAANPADTDRLRLDAEMRDIDQALQQAPFRDRFDITWHGAVQVADLQGYLLRHKPDIVHFSGHGDQSSEIVLEDSSGKSQPVPVRALSRLFFVLKDNIRCVVLNACYSEQQAKAIAEHIDCVIGMSKAIGDTAAISFAIAFYQALGYGKSVQTAFDLGRAQIDLENLGEQDTPKLLALNNDPETVVFVHNSSK